MDEETAQSEHSVAVKGIIKEKLDNELEAQKQLLTDLDVVIADRNTALATLEETHAENIEGIIGDKNAEIERLETQHGETLEGIVRTYGGQISAAVAE